MKAVIFDFDGTIGDSFKVAVEIAHQLTHRSQLADPDEIARLRRMRMLSVALALHIPKYLWPFLLLRGRRMMTKRLKEVQPFIGIADVLMTLHQDGYQLFIVSSNSRQNIESFLTQHGLSGYLTKIYGNVGLLGKAPVLRKIIKRNNLTPEEVIYVGDESRDIEAAKQVNMPCVAVAWGYNAPELLQEHAPMVIVHSAKQLQTVLEEWGSALA